MRAIKKDVCLVFITAFSNDKLIAEIESLGATGYIKKPFKQEQLDEVIEVCRKKIKALYWNI